MKTPSNDEPRTCRLAILGSGQGTNARSIIQHSRRDPDAGYSVALIITTSATTGIADVAREHDIAVEVIEGGKEQATAALIRLLRTYGIDVLALAGYMRLLDPSVIAALDGRVLNIHPSLLPKHGGKGMYGIHVQKAVIDAGDARAGATVHLVSELYDEGKQLAQAALDVVPGEGPESLQERVRGLEHELYPKSISMYLQRLPRVVGQTHNSATDFEGNF